ncbi:hypothetical protein VTL71DRAFT_1503 [Oculimacula yallundae]|uniref:Uncharacterized protein n=1 Tax=Oculimacula yallundae TaxID=86028 RepID=A0ABR4CB07_9HELO
MLDSEPESLSF